MPGTTTAESGVYADLWELNGQGSYNDQGDLVWDQTTTAQLDGQDLGLTNAELTDGANGSIAEMSATWEQTGDPTYALGQQVSEETTNGDFLLVTHTWYLELLPGLSQPPLGSGSSMSILAAPLTSASSSLDKTDPEQIAGYSSGTAPAPNTLYNGFMANDQAYYTNPDPTVPNPAPIGSVIPPAAFEPPAGTPADPTTPSDPQGNCMNI